MFGLDLSWIMPAMGAIGGLAQLAGMFKKPKAPQPGEGTFLPGTTQPAVKPPTPQAAAMPDEVNRRKGVQAMMPGGMAGESMNTLLTGPGGISNSALTLGKSTLLGA